MWGDVNTVCFKSHVLLIMIPYGNMALGAGFRVSGYRFLVLFTVMCSGFAETPNSKPKPKPKHLKPEP